MSDHARAVALIRRLGHRTGRSRVFRAGFSAAVIRATGLVIVFAVQILLARLIGDTAEYGLYAWGQNLLFLLGSVFALGIPLASSRLIAVHAHRGDTAQVARVVRYSYGWLLVTCGGGVIAGSALVLSLPAHVYSELPRPIALLAVLAAPLVALTMLSEAHARAEAKLGLAFAPTQVLRPLLTGVFASACAFWTVGNLESIEVLLAVCLSLLVVALIQQLLAQRSRVVRSTPALAAYDANDSYAPSRLMRDALPLFATRISGLVMEYGSTLLLGIVAGPEAAAGFFIADRLASMGAIPRTVIGAVVQPWLASAYAERQQGKLQAVVMEASHASLWPTLAGCALLYFCAPFLLGLFGEEFTAAMNILGILLLAHVLSAVVGPTPQVLVMSGQQDVLMKIMAMVAFTHIVLLLLLSLQFGAAGAAMATLVSTLLVQLICAAVVRARLGVKTSALMNAFYYLRRSVVHRS